MRWLIVEDALRDHKGHWLEYLRVFRAGLASLGDDVRILADRCAESEILKISGAEPVLPESIWHQMDDGAGALKRFFRIFTHALATCKAVVPVLKAESFKADIIYVPTVLPHHLLAWYWMLKFGKVPASAKVLLYFLSTPVAVNKNTGKASFSGGPSARLLGLLLGRLSAEIKSGRVIIGVETEQLRDVLSRASGVQVTYLPQPVESVNAIIPKGNAFSEEPLMACFGAARHEKGSDILQLAIARYLQRNPESKTRFAIQWVDDFQDECGTLIGPDPVLLNDCRVTYVRRYIHADEYEEWILKTDVMLLPYRMSSYGLRGSRVALEALVDGLPVIITKGTAPDEHVTKFGASVPCEDGSVEDLVLAITVAEADLPKLKKLARAKVSSAREHFSVATFRTLLLNSTGSVGPSLP